MRESVERLSERYEVSLVGHRGTLQDLVFKILVEEVTIGRHPENDIVLDDPTISSQHARITFDGLAFELIDLGSKGGIRVNSKPVQQAEIKDGDRIRLGGSIFIFSVKPRASSSTGAPVAPGRSMMDSRSKLDSAAKVRIAAYSGITFILFIVMLALIDLRGNLGGPRPSDTGDELARVGTLAIETFTIPTHQPNAAQIRAGSVHLQRGTNELDSDNLLGAIEELKLALQSYPTCESCKEQLQWAFQQLRKKIAYHDAAGEDDFKNLRYQSALRQWDTVRKLVQPTDPIAVKLTKLMTQAEQKQAELNRRAVGLP